MQQNTLGNIAYEITNYLGNVNVVISDRKIWTGTPTSAFKACVVSRTDYFPFGMEISSRTSNSDNYRFGYNGMESDNETKGSGNSYTTEFRQYDPRIGRWLSLDPLMAQFPWQSPYCAFDNNPVINVDPLGLYSEKGANRKADRMERKGYENVSVVQSRDKDGNKTGNYGVSTTGKKDGSGYGHYFGSNDKKSSSSGQTNNVMVDAFSQVAAKSKSVKPEEIKWLDNTDLSFFEDGFKTKVYKGKEDITNWYQPAGKINGLIGVGASILEQTKGSIRITNGAYNGSSLSLKYYESGWNGGSRAKIKTFNISKAGKLLGRGTFVLGVAMDLRGMMIYKDNPNSPNAVHPAKAGLNTTMGAYGLWVNPVAGTLYFGVDAFYPGGWKSALEKNGSLTEQNQEIMGNKWNLYRDY